MNLLTVVATIVTKKEYVKEVGINLTKLVLPTRTEDGCVNYDLHQSIDNPEVYIFYENWKNEAHLDAHLKSKHITTCMNNINHMLEKVDVNKLKILK